MCVVLFVSMVLLLLVHSPQMSHESFGVWLMMNEWVNNDCEKHGLQEVNCLLVQEFVDSRKCCPQCRVQHCERKSIDCNQA